MFRPDLTYDVDWLLKANQHLAQFTFKERERVGVHACVCVIVMWSVTYVSAVYCAAVLLLSDLR